MVFRSQTSNVDTVTAHNTRPPKMQKWNMEKTETLREREREGAGNEKYDDLLYLGYRNMAKVQVTAAWHDNWQVPRGSGPGRRWPVLWPCFRIPNYISTYCILHLCSIFQFRAVLLYFFHIFLYWIFCVLQFQSTGRRGQLAVVDRRCLLYIRYAGLMAAGRRRHDHCLQGILGTTTARRQRVGDPVDDVEEQERCWKTLARDLVDTARSPLARLDVDCYCVLLSSVSAAVQSLQQVSR